MALVAVEKGMFRHVRPEHYQQDREHQKTEEKKKTDPFVKKGTQIDGGRILVGEMIGSGGFGQIYKGYNSRNEVLAVKVGFNKSRTSVRMVLEQHILQKLSPHSHFPAFICSGSTNKFNYICMELLGRNVHDLRKHQPTQRFSVETAFRIGDQVAKALKTVHRQGYLHRDVKPSNICTGYGRDKHTLYLVDFGLSRRYLEIDGSLRRFRDYASFRGTSRYVSCRVHEHQEHAVWDDICSLLYSVVELIEGKLPWRAQTESQLVLNMKKQYMLERDSSLVPARLSRAFKLVQNANVQEPVNYNKIRSFFEVSRFEASLPFEWEDSSSEESEADSETTS